MIIERVSNPRTCPTRRPTPTGSTSREAFSGRPEIAQPSDNGPSDPAIIFTEIYRRRGWGRGETVSGFGSTVAATEYLRCVLPEVLETLGVRTMLDIPCGDLNWMRPEDLPIEQYIGADVVPEVVAAASKRCPSGDFHTVDLSADPLPAADLIFCRDCFGHLSHDLVKASLRNILASDARYLMTTTFYSLEGNGERQTGGWMPINLQLPPYSLPAPILLVRERDRSRDAFGADKSMGVWDLCDASVQWAVEKL